MLLHVLRITIVAFEKQEANKPPICDAWGKSGHQTLTDAAHVVTPALDLRLLASDPALCRLPTDAEKANESEFTEAIMKLSATSANLIFPHPLQEDPDFVFDWVEHRPFAEAAYRGDKRLHRLLPGAIQLGDALHDSGQIYG